MEEKQELDRYLGLLPRPDERETMREALAQFGEVEVERSGDV